MTAPDLHPEDLIDRDEQGLLAADERSRLDDHVRRCVACRLARMARVDFEREAELQPNPFEVRRVVDRLLMPPTERRPASRVRSAALGRVLLAAALALVAGFVAAAVGPGHARPGPPSIVATNVRASPVHRPGFAPAVPPPSGAEVATATPNESWPPTLARPLSEKVRDAPVPPPEHAELPRASVLFEDAAVAQRAGDRVRAASLYKSLIAGYPQSPEAHTALAVFGRVLLDDGDDDAAVALFDRYLQSNGVLEQDALVGRALALERLGRVGDASQAWNHLLRAYPDSAHASRARSHLLTLAKR
jgi:tetratricopeptide (TPR) repeat protein